MNPFHRRAINNMVLTTFGTLQLDIATICIFGFLLLPVAWIPDGIGNLLDTLPKMWLGTIQLVTSGIIVIGLVFWIKKSVKAHERSIDVLVKKSENAKGLILFLSDNRNRMDCFSKASIDEMSSNNYQMPLLALQQHKHTLEHITVIASENSFNEYEIFQQVVAQFLPTLAPKLSLYPINDLNFEDAERVYDELSSAYNEMKSHIKEREIFIDITGGQKIISIVGAIFALPMNRNIQYVSTRDYSVKLYDIRYGKSPNT